MPDYYPTRHAVEAMAARGVTWAEVLEVLHRTEVSYTQDNDPRYPPDRRVHQYGRLYVVVGTKPTYARSDTAEEHPAFPVITVGLRQTRQWNDADVRNRHDSNRHNDRSKKEKP